MQWNRVLPVGAAILSLGATALAETVIETAALQKDGALYEVRVSTRPVSISNGSGVKCSYSVYRDGRFLHPTTTRGGTVIGCRYASKRLTSGLGPFGDVGWRLRVGSICGNTSSSRVTIIIPTERGYNVATFQSKFEPIIRDLEDRIEIWSSYQEWAGKGTATSFFVPELRYHPKESRYGSIFHARLPAALETWPELRYVDELGIFVAGLAQLNPEVMEVALSRVDDDTLRPGRLQMHGLPGDRVGLRRLIDRVRAARDLRDEHGQFSLSWTPRAGRYRSMEQPAVGK